MMSLPTNN